MPGEASPRRRPGSPASTPSADIPGSRRVPGMPRAGLAGGAPNKEDTRIPKENEYITASRSLVVTHRPGLLPVMAGRLPTECTQGWKQRPSSPLIGRFVQTRQSWVEGGYGYSDQSGLFWRRAFGERRSLRAGAAVRAWRARHQPAPAGRRPGRGGAASAAAEQPGGDAWGDDSDGAGGSAGAGGRAAYPGHSGHHQPA